MKKWYVCYLVGSTYKQKIVYGESASEAIKKAKVKNIIDLQIIE